MFGSQSLMSWRELLSVLPSSLLLFITGSLHPPLPPPPPHGYLLSIWWDKRSCQGKRSNTPSNMLAQLEKCHQQGLSVYVIWVVTLPSHVTGSLLSCLRQYLDYMLCPVTLFRCVAGRLWPALRVLMHSEVECLPLHLLCCWGACSTSYWHTSILVRILHMTCCILYFLFEMDGFCIAYFHGMT